MTQVSETLITLFSVLVRRKGMYSLLPEIQSESVQRKESAVIKTTAPLML